MLCGCERESGYGRYEPTLPGFYLFRQVDDALCGELSGAAPVFAFARYYATESDAEREEIHDAFFYTSRITSRGDRWHIIDNERELVIATGGKRLDEPDARWIYSYVSSAGHNREIRPSTTAAQSYTLLLPEVSGQPLFTAGEFTLAVSFESRPAASGASVQSIRFALTGSGTSRGDDIDVAFGIAEPLEFDAFQSYVAEGALTLTTTNDGVTDAATARYRDDGQRVRIEYNGHEKFWNTTYGAAFRYE